MKAPKLKIISIASVLLIIVITASCVSSYKLTIQKRHYLKGYNIKIASISKNRANKATPTKYIVDNSPENKKTIKDQISIIKSNNILASATTPQHQTSYRYYTNAKNNYIPLLSSNNKTYNKHNKSYYENKAYFGRKQEKGYSKLDQKIPAPDDEHTIYGIIGFIFSLLGLIFTFIFPLIGLIFLIAALIFSIIGLKSSESLGKTFSILGLSIASAGCLLWIILIVIVGVAIATVFSV